MICFKDSLCVANYNELFSTSINQECIFSSSRVFKDVFDNNPMIVARIRLVSAVAHKAYKTYGRVYNIAYMIDPIADAYGTLII